MSDATLWKRVQSWAQNNKLIVSFLALSAVLIILANTTKAIETLYTAVMRIGGGPEFSTRQECLDTAKANMRRISECYRDYP